MPVQGCQSKYGWKSEAKQIRITLGHSKLDETCLLSHLQLMEKVIYFLHHMRLQDEVGHKLHCSLRVAQLEVGMGTPLFQLDFLQIGFWRNAPSLPSCGGSA